MSHSCLVHFSIKNTRTSFDDGGRKGRDKIRNFI